MRYHNTLTPIFDGPPILADYPQFVEPLQAENRFLAPPIVNDDGGTLLVRSWRYWYNPRGIVEFENRLDAAATAVIVVHPWGIDDDHGMRTPEPAGCAFFCTVQKNRAGFAHMRDVINPFLKRMRPQVNLVGYSMTGPEDPIRKKLYASVLTKPEELDIETGERELAEVLGQWDFTGEPLVSEFELDDQAPVRSYFEQNPSTEASDRYNRAGYWKLPMPLNRAIEHAPQDRVFYDAEGYPKVRDYLKSRGIRHVLLAGYCTDMCVTTTTCGYLNMEQDFNVFLVGDATLASFPGSTTPRFATQVALHNAALMHMVTQAGWVRLEE
ncbi:MAG: cysteine hydrolase family protein [Armatimonadota bacterium]